MPIPFLIRNIRMRGAIAAAMLAWAAPQGALAAELLVSRIAPDAAADGLLPVDLTLLNDDTQPLDYQAPERIAATLTLDGRQQPVMLERRAETPARQSVAAGAFARLGYGLRLPAGVAVSDAVLTLQTGGTGGFAFRLPAPAVELADAGGTDAPPAAPAAPVVVRSRYDSATGDTGNSFLANLSPYQPIYAVMGRGTNSDARIQVSFKYQLFGEGGPGEGKRSWLEGIHFAYTQRLYWDLGADSSPFRNIDYMPELFYLFPAREVREGLALGGQVGVQHESNGRDGDASRSANSVYIQPVATMPVGGDYKLSIGPRFWLYGNLSDNPDLRRYRGNTRLFVQIGQDDGWRLSSTSRFNFGSGKGAIDAELSYPLSSLIDDKVSLYLFGHAFTGYGENLLDYNRHATRLRIGIAIVR